MRWITGYYLATPVFLVLDVAAGAPIRVAGLGQPGWRLGYYAVLFALGFLCRGRPRLAPVVGMGESAVNLTLLLLSVLLPIWSLPEQMGAPDPVLPVLGPVGLLNLGLSGSMAILSFKRNERSLYRAVGRDRPSRPDGRRPS